MKKVMILVALVGLLVFSVATSAFATTVYFDYMVGGKSETSSSEPDLDQYLIGVETHFGGLKVDLEYFNKATKGNTDAETTGYQIKGTFLKVEPSDAFGLYGTLSYLNLNGDSATNNVGYAPVLVGVEAKLNLSERMYIDGILDYAVFNKDYEADNLSDAEADYMAVKVKGNFLLTEHLGAAVGYNWTETEVNDAKTTDTGFIAGLTYKF